MPGTTARKTNGRTITKDRQAAAATTATNQGADRGHLLGMVLGIAIGIAIEIEIQIEEIEVEKESEIIKGTNPVGLTGAEVKCQATKASKVMTKT